MNLTIDPRLARLWRKLSPTLPYRIVEVALIALLAVQGARLMWALIVPYGPVGDWKATTSAGAGGDELLLARFDPFFRLGAVSGPAVVTSLAIKLYGVRVNEASGQGSAIIATPDGVQSSYAVGDEIMPGVKLKSVTFEGVTIERGGTPEQVFLDQSVVAPVAQPGAAPVAQPGVAAVAPLTSGTSIANEIGFIPRTEKGQVTGFVVSPKGAGTAFRAAGLQDGDVLTAINGQTIRTPDDVAKAMAAAPQTGMMMLSVERGGELVSLSTRGRP